MRCPTCSGSGQTEVLVGDDRHKYMGQCQACNGRGEIAASRYATPQPAPQPAPEPPLADVITALDAQAAAMGRVAEVLEQINRTLRGSLK